MTEVLYVIKTQKGYVRRDYSSSSPLFEDKWENASLYPNPKQAAEYHSIKEYEVEKIILSYNNIDAILEDSDIADKLLKALNRRNGVIAQQKWDELESVNNEISKYINLLK